MSLRRLITLIENARTSELIYHWADARAATRSMKTDTIKQKTWKHFIPQVGKYLRGVSFGYDAYHWSEEYQDISDICFVINRQKLTNTSFDINGERTFLMTREMLSNPEDAGEILSKCDVLSDPTEVFVIGSIFTLHTVLDRIIVKDFSRGSATRSLALWYKDTHGVPIYEGRSEIV